MKTVLIAGGTGYIGKHLEQHLLQKGYAVKILSRNPTRSNHVFWNPETAEIDTAMCSDVQILINLCGEPVDKKRWSKRQKQRIIDSRVETTKQLFHLRSAFPSLEHYISASGITAYGFDDGTDEHSETDNYGSDFLSHLVEQWEKMADLFSETTIVSKIRIAVVFEQGKGALKKMSTPIKMGVGASLGSGKQQVPWVHISDLVRIVDFLISNQLAGTFNTNANNHSNEEITKAIAKQLNKRLWMPNIPAFVVKILFGQLSEMLLCGAKANNGKLLSKGFVFKKTTLEESVNS